jgi:hypothetical protein
VYPVCLEQEGIIGFHDVLYRRHDSGTLWHLINLKRTIEVTSDIVPEDFRVKIEVMSLRTEAHKFYQGQTDTTTLMSSAGNNICYANTLTNSAKLCPSWKDDCRSTTEQIPSILRSVMIHCRVHKRQQLKYRGSASEHKRQVQHSRLWEIIAIPLWCSYTVLTVYFTDCSRSVSGFERFWVQISARRHAISPSMHMLE